MAHNFNNVLMAISSNAETARSILAAGGRDELDKFLDNVVVAAKGGKDVARRLAALRGQPSPGHDQLAHPGYQPAGIGRLWTWPASSYPPGGKRKGESDKPGIQGLHGARGERSSS